MEDDLLGVSEAATLLGVSRQTISNWRSRQDGFPQPAADLRSGPIWLRSAVVAWARAEGISIAEESVSAASDGVRSTKVVSVVNMKGGVGKSTITANLGWFCAYKNDMRVLLVDLDPQFNLSQYALGTTGYEAHLNSGKGSVLNVFERMTPSSVAGVERGDLDPSELIAPIRAWNDGSRIDLLPSSLDLSWTLKNPHQKEQLLAPFLEQVRDDYDLVLIDCPPTDSMLTSAAYLASSSVLVPVKPEFLSTIGLPLLVRSLQLFEDTYSDSSIDVLGIVFNATSDKLEHDRSRSYVRKIAKQHGWPVFKSEVSYSDSYPKGSRTGRPIFLTDYARNTKIADFYSVANEFLQKLSI